MDSQLQLHLSRKGEVVARFDDLRPGPHDVGADDECDLLVTGVPCPAVLCKVNVSFDREIHVSSAGVATIKDPEARHAARQRLAPGGFVDIDDYRLTLLLVRPSAGAIIHHTGSVAPPTAAAPGIVSPAGEPMSLEFENQGRFFVHDLEGRVLVGRGARKDRNPGYDFIQLDQGAISRDHLEVFKKDGRGFVKALDSVNGTFVNGNLLVPGSAVEMLAGTLVQLTQLPGYPSFLYSTRAKAIGSPRGSKPYLKLLGNDRKIRKVKEQIEKLFGSKDAIVVILGPSGSGKELAAQALHAGWCLGKPFLAINCGAIPPSLIETELFGHEKGAFTGADRRRLGLFESAQGGLVFLDEIGELPLLAQVKLLRVLQERKVQRVGSSEWVSVHFRLVCATHRSLFAMVQKGTFREDLYHRIAQSEILMPALAERAGDIPLLARSFLEAEGCEVTPAALAILQEQEWPGNVRQLHNVLKRSLDAAGSSLLDASDLVMLTEGERKALSELEAEARQAHATAGLATVATLEDLDGCKRQICERAVRDASGNRTAAAQKLGINPRTLMDWLKAWGI
jgi:DNA-binding NtrC family response regulator